MRERLVAHPQAVHSGHQVVDLGVLGCRARLQPAFGLVLCDAYRHLRHEPSMHVRDERETRCATDRLARKRRRQRLGVSRHPSVEGLARFQRSDTQRTIM
jgi:hypothetical protein